uniref:Centriolar and ciliogenesis-associated protein HYLS1 C-terminal domain-containing protein n=1 Tax=Scleropages formosus TaxID=113540 RepID=A0A8D0CJJ8_SCLFO
MPHCPSAEDDDGNDPEQPEESDHYTRYSAAPSTGMLRSGGIGTESRHSLSSPSPERERAASRSLVFKRKFVRFVHKPSPPRSSVERKQTVLRCIHFSLHRKQSARSPVCNESTRTEGNESALSSLLPLKEKYSISQQYRSHHRNDIPTQPKSCKYHPYLVPRYDIVSSPAVTHIVDFVPVIHPQFHHPHSKNWKKTDPVTRYFQYRQHWDMFKVPGENKWMELRREIREQMTYSSQPLPNVKRTSRTVPKTSVVPTEKKRLALRWKVRHDLANGIMPAKFTYPF